MEVYKVVERTPEDELLSIVTSVWGPSEFVMSYAVGAVTLPPSSVPDAWLFAFESLEFARRFIEDLQEEDCAAEIYRAGATEVKQPETIAQVGDVRILRSYWRSGLHSSHAVKAGTVLCSDITLIERVWP